MNRTVAAIGVIGLLAAVYVFFIAPLADKRVVIQERLEIDYGTLYKYQKVFWNKERVAPRLEQSRKALEQLERNIFPETDTSVTFAKLQMEIQNMAATSGLTVTSIKPLPTVSYKHYTGLPLFMDCTGNIKQLGSFFKLLDAYNVFFSIDRLNIAALQDGRLRIKMQLSGLMSSA
jgi:Tfp pilus assembly protein PilO